MTDDTEHKFVSSLEHVLEHAQGKDVGGRVTYVEDPHQLGVKLDAGKPRADLLLDFGLALESVAELATYGAIKHTDGGWLYVEKGADRYTAAMIRHLLKEGREEMDPEFGLKHAVHVAWNALARLELMLLEDEKEKVENE